MPGNPQKVVEGWPTIRAGYGVDLAYNVGHVMRFHDSLDQLALAKPDLDFAIQDICHISYRQAATEADRLANALIGAGLQAGDRVAVLAKNSIEFAVLYFAASKAEVVLVTLNYRLAPPEWSFILNDAEAKVLFAGRDYLAPLDAIRAELRTVSQFVCIDSGAPGWTSAGEWTSRQPAARARRTENANPEAVQMYTSGTTGRPKGAVLTHQSLISMSEGCMPWFAGEPAQRYLVAVPMFHIFGAALMLTAPLVQGTLFVIPEFQPATVIRVLREEKIAVAWLVPTMIQACLNQPNAAGGGDQTLQGMVYGTSPIAEATLRKAMDVFRCEFLQAYGMTEIAPLTALPSADHHRALSGQSGLLLSAGRAVDGVELRIVDFHDRDVTPGTVGEIVARSASLMAGYWKQPEATGEAVRSGWMHTGDMGYLDSEGYVYIQDA